MQDEKNLIYLILPCLPFKQVPCSLEVDWSRDLFVMSYVLHIYIDLDQKHLAVALKPFGHHGKDLFVCFNLGISIWLFCFLIAIFDDDV